ncbi:hypothetical protein [Pseudorhodoferax sp. Leaf274]|uniref:hypothetical protein n=1 Tax=Pseudorhodoferax sp. Leaf274 TaxID=1736318 RepID=UPI0009EB3171|nr:hypothetical protein [Pseudorhodoferax sp. Leaf274]
MRFVLLTLALLLAGPARADDGHNHGGAQPAAAGPALPRFSAATDLFELVGVLDGHHLRVWLDHAPSNAPVENAQLVLELDGQPLVLKAVAAGEFEAELAAEPGAGTHPVTATVTAGADADLLAGELDIHAAAMPTEAAQSAGWRSWAPWVGGGLVLLLALATLFKRRNPNLGAAA